MASAVFQCKKFLVEQEGAVHPVGTDSMLLGAWATGTNPRRVLDIGTGTGIIALMLAQKIAALGSGFWIDGVELHSGTAACARRNFASSNWANSLRVLEMPVQQWANESSRQYDLIVSNPPFFTETIVSPNAERRLGRDTGSLSQSDLIHAVVKLLAPGGQFCTILPPAEAQRFAEQAVVQGLYWTAACHVFSRPDKPLERVLMAFENNPYPYTRSSLYIRNADATFSAAYRALTGDFYL